MHATWQTLKSGKPQWLTRHPISITLVPIAMMRGHSGKFELFGFVTKDVLFYRFARFTCLFLYHPPVIDWSRVFQFSGLEDFIS